MSAAKPFGSGDNFIRYYLPFPDLGVTHEGLPRSCAAKHILSISRKLDKGDNFSKVVARVYAAAVPVFLGASLIQLFSVAITDEIMKLAGHPRKVCVITSEESDSGGRTFELKNASFIQNAKKLIGHTLALFHACVYFFPGIFVPGLYYRESLKALPQSSQEKKLAESESTLSETQETLRETQEKLRQAEEKAARAKKSCKDAEEDSKKAQEALEQTKFNFALCKLGHFFSQFPKVTPNNVDKADKALPSLGLEGVTLSVITKGENTYSQKSWGTAEGYFQQSDFFISPPVADSDQFLKPPGVVELTIDGKKVSPGFIASILKNRYNIHRLVMKNCDPPPDFNEVEVLKNVHSLVLEGGGHWPCEILYEIAQKFPNIACFDLKGCKPYEALNEGFLQSHIVSYNEISPSERSEPEDGEVQATLSRPWDNMEDQLKSFNQKLFNMAKGYDPGNNDLNCLASLFRGEGESFLFHPAAPFITTLSCFKGLDIKSLHLQLLMKLLAKQFPHLRCLDFSDCRLLDVKALDFFRDFPVLVYYLDRCDVIFFRRLADGDSQLKSNQESDKYFFNNRRHYLLDAEVAAGCIRRLLCAGVQVIIMRNAIPLPLVKKGQAKSRKGPQPEASSTYFEMIESCFARSLDGEVKVLEEPYTGHTVYVGASSGEAKETSFKLGSFDLRSLDV